MRKYELSLSRDYVPSWTVVDAVRELFQNALDQQTTMEDNEMFFNYNESEQTLYIGNKSSVLDVKTLLLGTSTKRNDPNTIGQFGEGYKVATLVLTRLGKNVTFYNYGNKEVWKPRFVKARRYNGAEILTFFIDSKYFWQKVPDNNLTITIENISPLEYQEIIDSNLHCQEIEETIETNVGRMLLDDKHRGKVFVNGLYVCSYEYVYGYDFKPKYLELDRDRKLADSFKLKWLASQICSQIKDHKVVIDLIQRNAPDVEYISSMDHVAPANLKNISNKTLESFKKEHGENAIPVTNQQEFETVQNDYRYRPVYVSNTYSTLIKSSEKYEPPEPIKKSTQTVKSKLDDWLKKHSGNLSKKAKNRLKRIIEEVMD